VRLRRPPTVYPAETVLSNHVWKRISPDVTIALGMNVERVLGDAMAGDATLFAREDYVEEAWRIVDPVLAASTRVHEYEPGAWGPDEADPIGSPAGGWHDPTLTP
jgi:glucose-6-phosphate 1-dehydrogenase